MQLSKLHLVFNRGILSAMETPEEFLKFIDLISNKLFHIKDEIVIFDLEDFEKIGYSEPEFRIAVSLLKEKNLIASERRFQDLKIRTRPPSYKKKLDWLILDDWFIFFTPERHIKDRYIIQLNSREKFLEFCDQYKTEKRQASGDIGYDPMSGVIAYNGTTYAIESKLRKNIVGFLWERKRVMQDEKVIVKGEAWPKESMAVNIDLIRSSKDYPKVKDEIKQAVSQLNNIFKDKKFPIKIITTGGIQLIVNK